MNYLLDTCVLSDLASRTPNARVVQWMDGIEEARFYLSVIAIGEIRKGIEKLPPSPRRTALLAWLEDQLLVRFGDRLLPIDTATMLRWGELTGGLEQQGRPLPAIDSLLAATALHHGLCLVTRNEADFRGTGVTIVNPWG